MFSHPSLLKCTCLIEQVHNQQFDKGYGLLITGLSGTGKTFLAKYYQSQFKVRKTPELTIHPVIYVKLSETRTATDLLLQIIKSFTNVLGRSSNKAFVVQDRLSALLIAHQVELIIIDEVQECLTDIDGITSQRMAKQIAALIDNNPQVGIVLFGTPVAGRLLQLKYGKSKERLRGEEQLSRRFLSEQSLTIIPSRCDCWLNCCNYAAETFKFSTFSRNDLALLNRLHVATEGKIGLLLKLFSIASFSSGETNIERFESAYLTGINSSAYNPFDEDVFSDTHVLDILDIREFS
ncbi:MULTISPECIES: AAA family ATPase [unclassified Pseudoalteromonas]|uniref:AAA family ATPase n=1 Tax=unclassified Pseudoalteromonas TaxID=194690 RepID=UPI000C088379|nr:MULTISPECIES: AAA family ATPase [unclassified Pseudoalteromonas]MDP2636740.1 AAA family ATPase [Pseudoalteromonas sp. 1_MG-2023]PHN88224.1 hypothetical protein CSC79_18990 [Pseudoalteromonas sp. 3D05]